MVDRNFVQTDINGNVLRSAADKPIAYLYGSFWYDPECAQRLFQDRAGDLSPAYSGDTLDVYAYHCDGCGTLIQAQKIKDEGEGEA